MEEKKFDGAMPTLVFDETATAAEAAPAEEEKVEVAPVELEETLSEEEMKVVESCLAVVHLKKSASVLRFAKPHFHFVLDRIDRQT